jgi:predicted DNA-binding transcriptional regulator AlpA
MPETTADNNTKVLKDTAWLAKRLNLSVKTIERFRAKGCSLLPPPIRLGNSIRYDEESVEAWLKRKVDVGQKPDRDKAETSADK